MMIEHIPSGGRMRDVLTVLLLVCSLLRTCLVLADMDNTALCNAVKSGSLKRVQDYLDKMKPDVNMGCTFINAQFPLHVAAMDGFVDIGRLLIENGADVNRSGILGYTPLLHAADSLHPEVVELLLQNKADIGALLLPIHGVTINACGQTLTMVTLGMNVMTVATAGYLRKYPFLSTREQASLKTAFYRTADLLFEYCFDFVADAQVAQTRLASEDHMDECNYISNKANQYQPNC